MALRFRISSYLCALNALLKKLWKISKYVLLSLLVLLLTAIIVVRIPAVQQYVARQAAGWLSEKLKTEVKVEGFSLSFLDKLSLDGILIRDLNKDTLLYTGHLEVNLTDWFIFKEEKELKYIGLKDAYIYLNRPKNDSVWNYQFIAAAFSSKDQASKDSGSGFNFSLKKAVLENVHFISRDLWVGEDQEAHVQQLSIDVRNVDFKQRRIIIDQIMIANSSYGLRDYKGGRPAHLKPKRVQAIDTTPFNPDGWQLALHKIEIKDSRFFLDNPDEPAGQPGLYYEWKMDINPIQLRAEDIKVIGDTLTGDLKFLSAKDRSGVVIKEMRAKVTVSPKLSECKALYLETNNSVLQDYYAMHYERFPDFIDYMSKVRMEGRFKNAQVAMDDITFFAPEMALFKGMVVSLDGKGGGTVDKLYANEVTINDGRSELAVGDFSMEGLPDIDRTFMSFQNSTLKTTGANLLHYFPAIAQDNTINWLALKNIDAPFELIGSVNSFNVKTDVSSGLGKLAVNGNFNYLLEGIPEYEAKLGLNNFQLGGFINTDLVNRASGNFAISGKSFDSKQLQVKTEGKFDLIETKTYALHNLGINGLLSPGQFDGKFEVHDENAVLQFEGSIKNLLSKPEGDLKADIKHLNLKAFGLVEDQTTLAGLLEGHFDGLSVDQMLGEATLKQMTVKRDADILDIDSIYLKSLVEDDIRYLYLGTSNLSARLWGDYKIVELPQTINHFLSKYLPNYFTAPVKYDPDQLIYFDVNARNINDLLSIFSKDIQLPRGGSVAGTLNVATDQVTIDAFLPEVGLNGVHMDSLFVKGTGGQQSFDLTAGTATLGYGANTFLNRIDLTASLADNLLQFKMTTATLDEFGNATLNGKGELLGDKVVINILPSQIFVNNNTWTIPAGNEIVYNDGRLNIANFEINSDNQHIYINKSANAEDAAHIELINLGIAPVSRLLQLDQLVSGGNISGEVDVVHILDNPVLNFSLSSNDVKVQGEPIQSLRLKGRYEQEHSMLYLDDYTGVADKDGKMSVSGSWALGSRNVNAMSGLVNFDKANLVWLSPVLKGYVNQLEGRITGKVMLNGNADKLNTEGQLQLTEVKVRPEVLGERYSIPSGLIVVKPDEIDLGNLEVRDMQDNIAKVSGVIRHQNLVSYDFDARVKSDKFRVLNLASPEVGQYYGTIDAKLDARITGAATDIKVQAALEPLEHSSLVIPLDFSSDVGTYNYIKFKKTDEQLFAWRKKKLKFSNKYNIRIDAVINNNLSTNIVMDPKTNDELFSRGEGNIVMEIPSDGDIKLNGNYKIESGHYNFAFRQMQILNYNREFNIVPGSTIVWSGDLYDAHLNVTGITTVKARLYDLIANEVNRVNLSQQEIADAQLAQMINVRLRASNTLQNPDIDFKIELTENRSIGTYAYQKLERLNTDETQLLTQVASLLLLDQFAPPEGFMNNTAAVSSGTLNNVTDIVSSVASSQLTNWANKLFRVEDLHVGVRYKNYNLNNSLNNGGNPGSIDYLNRNEAKLSVRKNFLNNRLLVDVGGVYDWGRPSQVGSGGSYTSNLAGDFMAQYLIRRDGRVRFNIFRTSNYDALFQQNISRQGVGLSYRRSFNNVWELFGLARKAMANDSTQKADTLVPTAVPVDTIKK